MQHRKGCKERINIPRKVGSRGITYLIEMQDKHIANLRRYFLTKARSSELIYVTTKTYKNTPPKLEENNHTDFTQHKERKLGSRGIYGKHSSLLHRAYIDHESPNK
jgi:hypothetical protein